MSTVRVPAQPVHCAAVMKMTTTMNHVARRAMLARVQALWQNNQLLV